MSKWLKYSGVSKEGCHFQVICKGVNKNYFIVRFQDGYEKEFHYSAIYRGEMKNPYHPSVYGVGYVGEGSHIVGSGEKVSREYRVWKSMLCRCYYGYYQAARPTYIGCSVAQEWHNFQNFADWYTSHRNYSKGYDLDKDLKFLGNKVYSNETCDLVPSFINTLLTDCRARRGEYSVGVKMCKSSYKYLATCQLTLENGDTISKHLGSFVTEQEAFFAYKKAKEENVKRVAEMYRDEICIEVYNSLMKWSVPIPIFKGEQK